MVSLLSLLESLSSSSIVMLASSACDVAALDLSYCIKGRTRELVTLSLIYCLTTFSS